MKRRSLFFLCFFFLFIFSSAFAEDLPKRFFKVTHKLYRGAQPTDAQFFELKKLGIKTVVNLRSFHSDRKETKNAGLGYEHIYMKPWHGEEEDLVRFLQIVTEDKNAPFFVHCQHGSDRTGLAVATYRVAVCGWTKEQAISEMTEERFSFHTIWSNLISFFKQLDIEKIKKEAGLDGKKLSCE